MSKLLRIAGAMLLVLLTPACGGPQADIARSADDEPPLAAGDAPRTVAVDATHDPSAQHAQSTSHAAPAGHVRLVADQSGHNVDSSVIGIHQIPPTAVEPTAADLLGQDGQFTTGSYRLLNPSATNGRFPTGVAIARLRVELTPDNVRRLQLDPLLDRDAAPWNGLADDVPAVREITLSSSLGQPPAAIDLRELVHSATGLRSGLCLTYIRWGEPIYDMRVFGVLWDAQSVQPLATFDACAAVTQAEYDHCIAVEPIDERNCRADDLAQNAFERQVLDVLYELAKRDTRATSTQPNPWQTDRPLFPRDDSRRYGPRFLDPRFWRQ